MNIGAILVAVALLLSAAPCAAEEIVDSLEDGVHTEPFSLAFDETRLFKFEAGSDPKVHCEIVRFSGEDAHLYVRWNEIPTLSYYSCRTYSSPNSEGVCLVSNPVAGSTLYLMVHAYEAFSGAVLMCKNGYEALEDAVHTEPFSLLYERLYARKRLFTFEAGFSPQVRCTMSGENGDADMYVKWNEEPHSDDYVYGWDCAADGSGSNGRCVVNDPLGPSLLFVMIRADKLSEGFSDVTVMCENLPPLPTCSVETVDFEQFSAGDTPTYLGFGVSINGHSYSDDIYPAMIFDSSNPTGRDFDLRTDDLGMILILSEDGDSTDPDDSRYGGLYWFQFDERVRRVESMLIVDNEEVGSTIVGAYKNGRYWDGFNVPTTSNRGRVEVRINQRDLSGIDFEIVGSGAVGWLKVLVCYFCSDESITFDEFSSGDTPVDLGFGISVFGVSNSGGHPAMIFDTENPTGGDTDLGTLDLGKVLILSEDNDSSDPDDSAIGGNFTFTFDSDMHTVKSITLLDTERSDTVISGKTVCGNPIEDIMVPVSGDGGVVEVGINEKLIELVLITRDSLAIAKLDIVYCSPSPPVEEGLPGRQY